MGRPMTTMKVGKIKLITIFIVVLILFASTASAFTVFDDDDDFISPSSGISACEMGDDVGHADETPLPDLPASFCLLLIPFQAEVPSYSTEAVFPARNIPFLNHISRAPPLCFS